MSQGPVPAARASCRPALVPAENRLTSSAVANTRALLTARCLNLSPCISLFPPWNPNRVRMAWRRSMRLVADRFRLQAGPALVGRVAARPEVDQRRVAGCVAGDVEAQPGGDAADRSVGVDGPLLIGPAVAVPELHLRTRCGTDGGIQAFAEDPDGATADGPSLVGRTRAVPDDRLRAVRGRAHRIVEAAAGGRAGE